MSSAEEENGIPFSSVPIELTESAAIYNDRIKMTTEQLEIIKELSCDEIQGFYYAKPMPEGEFIEYIGKHQFH